MKKENKFPYRSIEDGTRARRGLTQVPKGFTLFTALVGVLLVVLGVLLAQSMSSTERSTTEIIAENRLDQEMIDTAVLAQADSLQEFNFQLRLAVKDYFSSTGGGGSEFDLENYYALDEEKWALSGQGFIEEVKRDFQKQHFWNPDQDTSPFAEFASGTIYSNIEGSYKNTPDFLIRIPTGTTGQREDFRDALEKTIELAGENFMEEIECNGTSTGCPKGTFYINLDFGALSDGDYESLPKIEVIKKSTCKLDPGQDDVSETIDLIYCTKKIRIPIVPRANVRVLVPLRVFRAISAAGEIARDVYSTRTNETLAKTKLGVCDSKGVLVKCGRSSPYCTEWYSCAPRNKPEEIVSEKNIPDRVCVGHETGNPSKELRIVDIEGAGYTDAYNPYGTGIDSMKNSLEKYVYTKILFPEVKRSNTALTFSSHANDLLLREFDVPARFGVSDKTFFFGPFLSPRAFPSRTISGTDEDDYSVCSKIDVLRSNLVFEETDPVYTLGTGPSDTFRFSVQLEKNDFLDFGLDDHEKTGFTCNSNPEPSSCRSSFEVPFGCGIVGECEV